MVRLVHPDNRTQLDAREVGEQLANARVLRSELLRVGHAHPRAPAAFMRHGTLPLQRFSNHTSLSTINMIPSEIMKPLGKR